MEIFKLVGSIFVDNEKANQSIAKTDEKAQGTGKTFAEGLGKAAKWGAAVAAAAGAAAVAITTKAVKAAAEWETQFAKVQTLLRDGTDLNRYKNDIIRASSEMGVAVGDYADAVYNAISAGVEQGKAVEFTKSALKLAEGGFTDATTAVDVLTTSLNAYGKQSGLTDQKVADLLITTQNLGKTTVNELASSVGKVIPIASAYNVNMENLSATYATLTAGGIATAESTTYMKTMIKELGDSGSKVSAVLKNETGKSFADLMKEGKSLGDVIGILGDAVNGDTGAFNELWSSSEAGLGGLALLSKGVEGFNETLGAMQNATGATEEAYKKMHNTLNGTVQTIKTNGQNLLINIGTALLPAIQKIADFLVDMMPTITGLAEKVTPLLSVVVDVVSFLLNNLPAVATVIAGVTAATVASSVATMAKTAAEEGSTLATTLHAKAQAALNATFLANPIGIVIAAIAALVAAFVLLWNNCEPFREFWIDLWEKIKTACGDAVEWIKNVWSAAVTFFLGVKDKINNNVITPIKNSFNSFKTAVTDIFSAIYNDINSRINNIKTIFTNLINFVKNVFTGNWKGAWDNVKNIFIAIAQGIGSAFKSPINFIIRGINTFTSGLNKIKIPDWVPGVGGKGFHIGSIPYLAAGGVLEKGQVGLLEGNGAEAVVPLENNRKWIKAVAKDMDAEMGGGNSKTVELLAAILDTLEDAANTGLYIDGKALVGAIAPEMDRQMGRIQAKKARA